MHAVLGMPRNEFFLAEENECRMHACLLFYVLSHPLCAYLLKTDFFFLHERKFDFISFLLEKFAR